MPEKMLLKENIFPSLRYAISLQFLHLDGPDSLALHVQIHVASYILIGHIMRVSMLADDVDSRWIECCAVRAIHADDQIVGAACQCT